MLGNNDASANLAVKDLNTARKFYEGTLGLKQVGSEGDELIVYRSGKTTLNVYRSKQAGTNKATAVTWVVGDALESTVKELAAKGVKFEHYAIRHDPPFLERRDGLCDRRSGPGSARRPRSHADLDHPRFNARRARH